MGVEYVCVSAGSCEGVEHRDGGSAGTAHSVRFSVVVVVLGVVVVLSSVGMTRASASRELGTCAGVAHSVLLPSVLSFCLSLLSHDALVEVVESKIWDTPAGVVHVSARIILGYLVSAGLLAWACQSVLSLCSSGGNVGRLVVVVCVMCVGFGIATLGVLWYRCRGVRVAGGVIAVCVGGCCLANRRRLICRSCSICRALLASVLVTGVGVVGAVGVGVVIGLGGCAMGVCSGCR